MNRLVSLCCTAHSLLQLICDLQLMCDFSFNTPLQTHGRNNHEFVLEVAESGSSVPFGEDVSHLIKCGQVLEFNVSIVHIFPNQMNVNFYVLCPCMMNLVGGKSKSS
jgi:hypothetical protein